MEKFEWCQPRPQEFIIVVPKVIVITLLSTVRKTIAGVFFLEKFTVFCSPNKKLYLSKQTLLTTKK